MQIQGTKEAFEKLISERGIYKKLGVDVTTVSNWKIYLKAGKSISLDKMEEMLIKGGATVAQEKVWNVEAVFRGKGRNTFTEWELNVIRDILTSLRQVNSDAQKNLRDGLRKEFDFYISDFEENNSGFGPKDLDDRIRRGVIGLKS